METPWLATGAFLGLLLGFWLLQAGRRMLLRHGLGGGRTISLDRVTLTSRRLRLVGRPDRLYRIGGMVIPLEIKSSLKLQPSHIAQLGVYFILIEEVFGIRPTHGFLLTGDGIRHHIGNTAELRASVLAMADEIRQRRQAIGQPVPVNPPARKCRKCGVRFQCSQARL